MINDIITAMTVAIHEEFGDGYPIYTEHVEQGLEAPCFFVFALNPSDTLWLGLYDGHERHWRTHPMVVQYIPGSGTPRAECNDVAERLYGCLAWITCIGEEQPVMGADAHYELTDEVLSFFVNYDFTVHMGEDEETMETLTQGTTIKED